MPTYPKRIYFQADKAVPKNMDFEKSEDVTWSTKRKNFSDIEYIHADIFNNKISFFEDKKLMLELCIKEAINLPKGQEPHLYSDYINNGLNFDESKNRILFSKGYVDLNAAKIIYNK